MSRTLTIRNDTTLVLEECISCGVQFGVTVEFDRSRRSDKQRFYCPNGHGQAYVESDADRLRKQLEAARARAAATADQLEAERRAHAATKGQLTKTRKRVAGGVCPCCNRSFVNLGRHMAGQHPGYGKEATTP